MHLRAPRSTSFLFACGVALCAAVVPLSLGPRAAAQQEPAPPAVRVEPVTVVFVRHAEKGKDDPRDPGLSEAGAKRARALARSLGAAGVTHLFSSEYRRTRETLQPLGEHTGVEVRAISARKRGEQLDALRALPPGSLAVVAGHSNTTPALAETLSGATLALEETSNGRMFGEDEYDRMIVVVLAPAEEVAPEVLDLRYGD